jgi:uncharacterized protein with HEPN domain
MSRSQDAVRLRHMLDASRKAIVILDGRSFEELAADERDRLAIERLLEIVGEAANHIAPSTMAQLDRLPWRDMIDMRNVVIHRYFAIEIEAIWKTVVEDLPLLVNEIEAFLAAEPS